MRLVIDSTFLIDHLRGEDAAVDRLEAIFEQGDEPIVTEIVVCEVRTGLLAADERHLVALLEPMEFVQPGPDAALQERAGGPSAWLIPSSPRPPRASEPPC